MIGEVNGATMDIIYFESSRRVKESKTLHTRIRFGETYKELAREENLKSVRLRG